jgi:hypothetical protein
MHLHALDYVLWVITPCLQIAVLAVLRARGLERKFRFFYWYTVFQVASDIYLLAAQGLSYRLYFYSYWIGAALSVLFTFALIDELFRLAFRDLNAIRNLGSYVFRWGMGILLLATCVNALSFSGDSRVAGFSGLILTGDRTARAMLFLLALLLLLGASQLRIPARSTLFGITLGFVIYMFSKVLLDTIALRHFRTPNLITRVSGVVYLSSCLLWLLYAKYGEEMPHSGEAISGAYFPAPRTSLIDTINAMVEHSMDRLGKTS